LDNVSCASASKACAAGDFFSVLVFVFVLALEDRLGFIDKRLAHKCYVSFSWFQISNFEFEISE